MAELLNSVSSLNVVALVANGLPNAVDFVLHPPMGGVGMLLPAVHSLNVCMNYRRFIRGQYWLFQLVVCVVGSMSGGTFLPYVMGSGTAKWLHSDYYVTIFVAMWYLAFYSPFDMVGAAYNTFPVNYVCACFSMITRTHAITRTADAAYALFPNSVCAGLLFGCLGGLCGTLFSNFVKKQVIGPEVPSELSKPTWSSHSAMICSVCYYVAMDPHNVIIPETPGPLFGVTRDQVVLSILMFNIVHKMVEFFVGEWVPFPFNLATKAFYFMTRLPSYTKHKTRVNRTITIDAQQRRKSQRPEAAAARSNAGNGKGNGGGGKKKRA